MSPFKNVLFLAFLVILAPKEKAGAGLNKSKRLRNHIRFLFRQRFISFLGGRKIIHLLLKYEEGGYDSRTHDSERKWELAHSSAQLSSPNNTPSVELTPVRAKAPEGRSAAAWPRCRGPSRRGGCPLQPTCPEWVLPSHPQLFLPSTHLVSKLD